MCLYVIEKKDSRRPEPEVLASRKGSPYLFTDSDVHQKVASLNNLRGSAFVKYEHRKYEDE